MKASWIIMASLAAFVSTGADDTGYLVFYDRWEDANPSRLPWDWGESRTP